MGRQDGQHHYTRNKLKIASRGNFVVVEFLWQTIEVALFHRKGGALPLGGLCARAKIQGRDEVIGQVLQTYLGLAANVS